MVYRAQTLSITVCCSNNIANNQCSGWGLEWWWDMSVGEDVYCWQRLDRCVWV